MARLTCWAACQEPAEWHKEAELETRVLRSQQVASPSPHNHPLQARFEKRSENSLQVCSLHLNRLLQRSQISHPWKKAWLVVQLCPGGGGGQASHSPRPSPAANPPRFIPLQPQPAGLLAPAAPYFGDHQRNQERRADMQADVSYKALSPVPLGPPRGRCYSYDSEAAWRVPPRWSEIYSGTLALAVAASGLL